MFIALTSLWPSAHAEEVAAAGKTEAATDTSADEAETMRAEARRLHDEADQIRTAAEAQHAQAQKDCWHKFLVSRCLEEAAQTLRSEKARAGGLDSRARALERDLKRREIAAKDARRAAAEAAEKKP